MIIITILKIKMISVKRITTTTTTTTTTTASTLETVIKPQFSFLIHFGQTGEATEN